MDKVFEALRAEIKDLDKAKALVTKFIERALEESVAAGDKEPDPFFEEFWKTLMTGIYPSNIDTIFRHSESEIEKLFLVSLMLYLTKNNIFNFVITPPFKNTNEELKHFRDYRKNRLSDIEAFKKETGGTESDYVAEIEAKAANGEIPKDDAERIVTEVVFEKNFVWDCFHITMQPAFPDILVDGKTIRCDMLVWKPDDERLNVIVECDGFEFHKEKPAFIRDRKRDRALKFKSFDVIRFSGSEIFTSFPTVSEELSNYIEFAYEQLIKENQNETPEENI